MPGVGLVSGLQGSGAGCFLLFSLPPLPSSLLTFPPGAPKKEVYFMAIIDILTPYDAKKKAAHAAKTVKHGVSPPCRLRAFRSQTPRPSARPVPPLLSLPGDFPLPRGSAGPSVQAPFPGTAGRDRR